MRTGLLLTGTLALALVALVPNAAAHATYSTDDGQYLITIGNLGEPVYTYQKTGLDLIIRQNTTAREEVAGVNATLEATIIAPGGETLACHLHTQHGATGRYTCEEGYTLTQPGLYQVRLEGDIMGSPVDDTYDMAHAIHSQSEIMFPDQGLPTLAELQSQIDALEAQIAQMQTHMDDMMTDPNADSGEAPGPGLALGLAALGLGLVAFVARRR